MPEVTAGVMRMSADDDYQADQQNELADSRGGAEVARPDNPAPCPLR